MNTTINISLPKKMYEDARTTLELERYSSISELVRDALRKHMYKNITVNGFTPEFEEEVLRAEKEPIEAVMETEKDIDEYFDRIDKEVKMLRRSS